MTVTRRQMMQTAAWSGAVGLAISAPRDACSKEKTSSSQPMLLQIYFQVAPQLAAKFERNYTESYVPALRKQDGYLRSNLLRLFPEQTAQEIEAATTEFNYQMELVFDTEENRRKWVASAEHTHAWPLTAEMAGKVAWRGFDIVGKDQNSR